MRVLLATDGSRSADRARDLVAHLAWPAGTTIRVVAGLEASTDLIAAPWIVPSKDEVDQLEARRLEHVNGVLDTSEAILARPGITVQRYAFRGRPGSEIVEAAREWGADLVVLGNRGHSRLGSMILGSTSAEVVDHAPCPVLIVREDAVQEVVLAMDGSTGAALAEHVITDWPIFRNLPVSVVTVAATEIPWNAGMASGLYDEVLASYAKDVDEARRETLELAEKTADRLRHAGIAAVGHAREGDPATELVEYAKGRPHPLVIMGSRGHTGLARLLLGGVARNVLHHASCSVLIVRENVTVRPEPEAKQVVAAR
jgi:nucleotide-binding universal stress UspA family protein